MLRFKMALALPTLCLVLASCNKEVVPLNIKAGHPERFICPRADGDPQADIERPKLPKDYVIDWDAVRVAGDVEKTLDNAKAEHEKYVAVVRDREGVMVGYVMKVEGANFICWDNMKWQNDVQDAIPPR